MLMWFWSSIFMNAYIQVKFQRNLERWVWIRWLETSWLVLAEGWKASQKTYLLASGQVKGLFGSHRKPISNLPVPQHPSLASSKPAQTNSTFYSLFLSFLFGVLLKLHQFLSQRIYHKRQICCHWRTKL